MSAVAIYGGIDYEKIEEIMRETRSKKSISPYTIDSPSPSTTYYIPETGAIDLTEHSYVTVFVKADQAVGVQLQFGVEEDDLADLEGYNIDNADFSVDKWNTIDTDINFYYMRVKITTGTTAPSRIDVVVVLRP